jgi:hypothetical protein
MRILLITAENIPMWKLLPLLLLVSCAAQESDDSVTRETGSDGARISRTLDLPLTMVQTTGNRKSVTKGFQQKDIRGWVRETGAWNISNAVAHTRLRCATYETGIQVGVGNPECSDVRWLTPVQFGTRQTQCNSATTIHSGGGQLDAGEGAFQESTCVRVVTRCDGAC